VAAGCEGHTDLHPRLGLGRALRPWWLFFSLSEDQIITDETEAGLRVLIRTDILAASARMEWAAETISDTSKVVDMVEQTLGSGRMDRQLRP
jgi:hypothetical protein